ncbi:MAG: hypothetical protein U0869_02480 [Chloroflexota bacterium]
MASIAAHSATSSGIGRWGNVARPESQQRALRGERRPGRQAPARQTLMWHPPIASSLDGDEDRSGQQPDSREQHREPAEASKADASATS